MKYQKIGLILLSLCLVILLSGFLDAKLNNNETEQLNMGKDQGYHGYKMYINDEEIGIVRYPAHGLSIYDKVIERLTDQYDAAATLEARLYFKEGHGDKGFNFKKEGALAKAIEDAVEVKMPAYGISIDGTLACYIDTEEKANQLLDMIMSPYEIDIEQKDGAKLEEIGIKEEILIREDLVLYQEILDIDQAFQAITQGPDSEKSYIVEEGDCLWSIAQSNETTVSELEAANPDLEGDAIKPGQELKLIAPKNLITVITKEKFKQVEDIEFEKEIRENNNLYKGDTKVVQEGKPGEKEIEYLIVRENGTQIEKEIIKETIITEPENEIIEEGTKAKPVAKPKPATSNTPSRSSSRDYTPVVKNGIEMTPWYGGAENIFTRGSTAKVTHVDTGLTFYVKRRGGTKHADSEPLTQKDTDIMRKIYGGSWSWNRKAIIVEVNGKKMAASMNGMPHGGSSVGGNGFSGHFCIHFYQSKGHASNKQDPDHQAMVKRAMGG